MKKKILVTGATGFIGSHLVKRLVRDGHYVTALHRSGTESLDLLKGLITTSFHDVKFPIVHEYDEIYHLAGHPSPAKYKRDVLDALDTSVMGAVSVLNCGRGNKAKVLLASTAEVYGNPTVCPQTEAYAGNVSTVDNRAPYSEGKRVAETYFSCYDQLGYVNARIVRLFDVYGPGIDVNDGRVLSAFISRCLNNEDITVLGTGNQTRTFAYIDDVINMLLAIMENGDSKPINVGSDIEITIKEIAELIISLTGSSSQIKYGPSPQNDPARRLPCLNKARALGWKETVTFEHGLLKMIDDIKSQTGQR